jgi:hypothetical protein
MSIEESELDDEIREDDDAKLQKILISRLATSDIRVLICFGELETV